MPDNIYIGYNQYGWCLPKPRIHNKVKQLLISHFSKEGMHAFFRKEKISLGY